MVVIALPTERKMVKVSNNIKINFKKDFIKLVFLIGGEPVDEIDTLCKDLYQSYQCLRIDYGDCTPGIDYDWKINKNGEPTCGKFKKY